MTVLALACWALPAQGASPPDRINYQGVLRTAAGEPADGNHDMVFRFHDAATGGEEILVDRHTSILSQPVAVIAGSGPRASQRLDELFRDYADVWMSVEIGKETLAPRVKILAAPFALNARHLAGRGPEQFVDTSAAAQTKFGTLTVDV